MNNIIPHPTELRANDARVKRLREITVIGTLIGIEKDELSDSVKYWILQTLAEIKKDYISSHSITSVGVMSNDGLRTTSSRILSRRKHLGLNETDLARQLNTYSNHISDWECGISEPPASKIIPLSIALQCDPMWLLAGSPADVAEGS